MSAMLDTFDAPMTDYGSDDVTMQVQSNPEPWLQGDGTMDDDSFISYNSTDLSKFSGMETIPIEASMSMPTFSGISTPKVSMEEVNAVEVEMEEYVEDHPEFEMADDEHTHEIQDVEVQDAPHNTGSDDYSAPQISFAVSTETSASIQEITSMVAPENEIVSRHSSHPPHEQTPIPEAHIEQQHHAESSSQTIDAEPTPAVEQHEMVDNMEPTAVESTQEQPQVPLETEHQDTEPEPVDTTSAVVPEAAHQAELEAPNQSWQEEVTQEESTTTVVETPLPVAASDPANAQEAVPELEERGHEHVEAVDASIDDHAAAAEAAKDAHGVHDGISVEPPPSIPFSFSDRIFSLFNRPAASSLNAPSHSDQESASDVKILLQAQPTLFYEPMSTVWKALREELSSHITDVTEDVEMLFVAAKLGLVLSEDNMYCQELSLHDLYSLHEAYDDQQPLELELQIQDRFIARYRYLYNSLQAELTDEDEEYYHALEHDVEQHADQTQDDVQQHVPETAEHEEIHAEQEEAPAAEPNAHQVEEVAEPAPPAEASHEAEGEAEAASSHQEEPAAEHLRDEAHEEVEVAREDVAHEEAEVAQEHAQHEEVEVAHEHAHHEEQHEEQQGQEEYQEQQEQEDATTEAQAAGVEEDQVHESHDQDGEVSAHEDELEDAEEYSEHDEDDGSYYDEEDDSESAETPVDEHGQFDNEQSAVEGGDAEDVAQEEVPNEEQQPVGTEDDDKAGTETQLNEEEHEDASHSLVDNQQPLEHEQAPTDQQLNDETAEHTEEHTEDYPDFTGLPELPEDDGSWDDELDGEGEVEGSWDGEDDGQEVVNGEYEEQDETFSNESSVTLSSARGSTKRGHSEMNDAEGEEEDPEIHSMNTPEKRTRLE